MNNVDTAFGEEENSEDRVLSAVELLLRDMHSIQMLTDAQTQAFFALIEKTKEENIRTMQQVIRTLKKCKKSAIEQILSKIIDSTEMKEEELFQGVSQFLTDIPEYMYEKVEASPPKKVKIGHKEYAVQIQDPRTLCIELANFVQIEHIKQRSEKEMPYANSEEGMQKIKQVLSAFMHAIQTHSTKSLRMPVLNMEKRLQKEFESNADVQEYIAEHQKHYNLPEDRKKLPAHIIFGANLRLVIYAAKETKGYRNLSFQERVDIAIPALEKSVYYFEPTNGARFSTYAVGVMKKDIRLAAKNPHYVAHVPEYLYEILDETRQATEQIMHEQGTVDVPINEAVEKAGYAGKESNIAAAMKIVHSVIGHSIQGQEKEGSIADSLTAPVEEYEYEVDETDKLQKALEELKKKPRLLQVIRLRFGLDDEEEKTLEEVGKAIGVTRERARQIQAKALNKLRLLMKLSK